MKSLKEALVHKHMDHYRWIGKASEIKLNQIPWPSNKESYYYILFPYNNDWLAYGRLTSSHRGIFKCKTLNPYNAVVVCDYDHILTLFDKVAIAKHPFKENASALWYSLGNIAYVSRQIEELYLDFDNTTDFDNTFTRLV